DVFDHPGNTLGLYLARRTLSDGRAPQRYSSGDVWASFGFNRIAVIGTCEVFIMRGLRFPELDALHRQWCRCVPPHSCRGPMRSVPPRGSGWVSGFSIFDFRLPIGFIASANRKSAIDNRQSRDPAATRAVVLTSWDRGLSAAYCFDYL